MLRDGENIIINTCKIFPAEGGEVFLNNSKETIKIANDEIFLKWVGIICLLLESRNFYQVAREGSCKISQGCFMHWSCAADLPWEALGPIAVF